MVDQAREANRKSNKRPRLPTLFFLNEEGHRKIHINRGKDLITTWNYPQGKTMKYTYSDVLRRYKRVFSTDEVAEMMHRRRLVLVLAIKNGMIPRPQQTYSLDENRTPYAFMWGEKDIIGLLEYLSTVHYGRPRKDGRVTPAYLPTPREVRAMINEEGEVLYVKGENGFVPAWRAKEF